MPVTEIDILGILQNGGCQHVSHLADNEMLTASQRSMEKDTSDLCDLDNYFKWSQNLAQCLHHITE